MAILLENADLIRQYDKHVETWKLLQKDNSYAKQILAIEETLLRFGLLRNEIKVYLHLSRAGEKKAGEIAEAISLHRTETYRILRELEKRGIVFSIFEKPLKFTAVPLDKAIDLLVDAQKLKIRQLEQEKEGVVELWSSIPQLKTADPKKELFQMLEGEQQMLMKANELVDKTKKEFKVFASADYLSQLYYGDFFDKLKQQAKKVNIALITDSSFKSAYFMGQLKWLSDSNRISDEEGVPCFIISDDKEVLISFHEKVGDQDEAKRKCRTAAIWTNYSAFVNLSLALFLKMTKA